MEFLLHGAQKFGEPGLFMSFEENADELAANAASLGFDVSPLVAQKKLLLDCVQVERSEVEEAGEFSLDGLFIRLNHAIDRIRAKRVVLDTVESLFHRLPNPAILRSELYRLLRWLKCKRVTAIITAEQNDNELTRSGLEEFVSDCAILLDHRAINQISTRRLRVIKYRGSAHGTNEYPFLIDRHGLSVIPVTHLPLDHPAPTARISSGIAGLDAMLGGKGYFRGSTVLVSGMAGAGKTSMAGHLADSACRRGERCLYFSFEESPQQIMRNLRSIGLKLDGWRRQDRLWFHAARPTLCGLEMHLVRMITSINEFEPDVVVLDPITTFADLGSRCEVTAMLARLIDFLKRKQITGLFTSLTHGGTHLEGTHAEVSSLTDTWLMLRQLEQDSERTLGLYILKSRGMAHSRQIRQFQLTRRGLILGDALSGPASRALSDRSRLPAR